MYGKNHCRISWPLFIYFIKNEEEKYRTENIQNEKDIIIEKNLYISDNEIEKIIKNQNNLLVKNIHEEIKNNEIIPWFK